MFTRHITNELQSLAHDYPVVTITGPRQSGKTTLVQDIFPDKVYFNLEALDTREFAGLDPRGFLEKCPDGAILDEIQRVPELLSYIQEIVDSRDDKGLFILTGSHQLELHQAISQSLAGRTALLRLLPLSITELQTAGLDFSLDEYLLYGGFPRLHKDKLDVTKFYSNYVQTYVERDVRRLINIKDLAMFQRFIKLCAGRVGQILNIHSLSNDLGMSSHTVKEWLSVLEASFLIFQLQPYFENFGKRVIKSPKLYFTDVGLLTYLLGIEELSQVNRDPLRGNLVENLVILELIKARLNQGFEPQIYFYRDSNMQEVDVVYQRGNQLIPIEIKAAKTFTRYFLKNLEIFGKIVGPRCGPGYLIYGGEQEQQIHDIQVFNYKRTQDIILTGH